MDVEPGVAVAGRTAVRRSGRGGFILLAVLAVMAIGAGLVGAMTLLARSAVDGAAVGADTLRADLLADAGVTLAAWQLFGLKIQPDALTGQEVRFDAGVVRLTVTGEAGRVDLNGSSQTLLAAAWRAAGRRTLSPEAFAGRVIDWRDADAEREEDGAEAPAYAAARLTPPRNGAFRTVGDLAFVIGVTPGDVLALGPFVTIANPDGRLTLADTPRSLILALPGMTPGIADRLVRAGTDAAASIPDALAGALVTEPSRVFRVRAELVEGPVRRTVEAIIIPGVRDDAVFHTVARTLLR